MAKKSDLFSVIVNGVMERDDEIKTTSEAAKAVNVKPLVKQALAGEMTGDEFADAVVAEGLRASLRRLRQQKAMAIRQVRDEGEAMKRADPRTLKPVTNVDVAAARAEVQMALPEEKP